MTDLSYNEAISELNALLARGSGAPPTLAELRDIIARTRVTQADFSNLSLDRVGELDGAILYSGYFNDSVHTGSLAKALTDIDSTLAIINNTHVGRLLLDDTGPFLQEVQAAISRENPGITLEEINKLIGDPAGGFWSTASEKFATAHSNLNIIALVQNPSGVDTKKIFTVNEIKALMQGAGDGAINGIPLLGTICSSHVLLNIL